VHPRLQAVYLIRSDSQAIEARAHALAVEQSVEMPVNAIDDPFVHAQIIGQVDRITDKENGLFEVCIALASETVGNDPGQLLNMLFGNSSLHDDVVLSEVELPPALVESFGGPGQGAAALRERAGAGWRALTCAVLKPQGLPPAKLAELATGFARGGVDYIKDDHGLADQSYSPFCARLEAVVSALGRIDAAAGARYVPSLSGDLDAMRRQLEFARSAGVHTVVVAPMIMGWSGFNRLVRDNPETAFIAHPSMAGAARILPPLLLGKLFRILGADAVIFPNHGGRFGYSPDTCRALAREALSRRGALRACLPVPAGGMSTARVPEMLDFYGAQVMLLIGGALLAARRQLEQATAAFVGQVHGHAYV
jgi:ribulose-bisphosphate carboxylase large chain